MVRPQYLNAVLIEYPASTSFPSFIRNNATTLRGYRFARTPRKLHAANVQTAYDTSLDYFDWASSKGIECSKLKLSTFDGLRGVEAVQDIREGEVLVAVPRDMALVVTPKMKCPFPDFVASSYWTECPWFLKMALLVLYERRKGSSSAVVGYMEHIPTTFDMPIHWAQEELQELQYPYIIQQVEQQRLTWRGYYDNLQAAVQGGVDVSLKEFQWALEAVRSRCFSGPYSGAPLRTRLVVGVPIALAALTYVTAAHIPLDQALNGAIAAVLFNILYDLFLSARLRWYAMCPVVDSMNHKCTVKNEVAYEYFRDSFSVTAQNSVSKNDQVYISYGGQSNDSLLQYYGFVEKDTPYDTYEVTGLLSKIAARHGASPERVMALESDAALKEVGSKATAKPSGFDDKVLQCVRFLLSSRDAPISNFSSPGSSAEESAVLDVLISVVEDELQGMGTTLQQDVNMLKTSHLMSERRRLAVEFRAAKKKVLMECLIASRQSAVTLRKKSAQ